MVVTDKPSSLWCVHILGPDTVIAARSLDEAETQRDRIQKTIQGIEERLPPDPNGYFPKMRAEVAPWPHSAVSHARDCLQDDRWDGELC